MVLLLPLIVVLMVKHSDARTHSLRYFRLGVSDPGHGIPEFISVGYVDSHPITTYDSVTRKKEPRAPWMAENLAPDHWERYTQLLRGWQQTFRVELKHLQSRYNHSEPPLIKVNRKETSPGITTLFCRAHGFYPPEISMTWMKNGEEIIQEIDYGDILPSGDGTYQTWISIEIDSQDSNIYSCHVEHCDLHMVLQVPRELEIIPLVMKAISGSIVLVIVLAGVGILAWKRRHREQKGIIYLPTPNQ
ncbi:major histocompatibility complex class I-related gene protein isoform X3 [Elephas maximus indicus]|uniref:major histocompatibility complex class I-related gene protein isoform X3 n=1 Tax=Elephas maximus indicus TaxID=99487 RepID=UPI002116CDA9|nr:major histocompatibility complex class I-related gene protein isoform X3 [Elephas maximus indicus]